MAAVPPREEPQVSESRGLRRSTVIVVALIAAVSLLVSWQVLTTVQAASDYSRCKLRHLDITRGLAAYESATGRLPPGTVAATGVDPEDRLSWVVALLPYIEQGTTVERFDLAAPAADPRNVAAADTRLRSLVCFASDDDRHDAWKTNPPVTHTVAVSGVGPDAAQLPANHPRAGLIGDDRGAKLDPKEIPDGLANTLLLAEIGSAAGHWARGGWGTLRHLDPDARPHSGPGRTLGGFHVSERNWFAANSHAAVVAMADGSVRTLSQRTDPAVLEALATARGGETVPGE